MMMSHQLGYWAVAANIAVYYFAKNRQNEMLPVPDRRHRNLREAKTVATGYPRLDSCRLPVVQTTLYKRPLEDLARRPSAAAGEARRDGGLGERGVRRADDQRHALER